jgi:hypothetical protein
MKLTFYKKIIIGVLLLGLFYNPSFFIPKTHAATVLGSGTVYPDFLAALTNSYVAPNIGLIASTNSKIAAEQSAQHLKTNTDKWTQTLLKVAGQAIKKLVLDRLANAATQWILNGGFEGKGGPLIQDWGAFFQQAGQEAVGMEAQQLLPWLCAPIKVNVALSFFAPQQSNTSVSCTLNSIVGNIDDLFKNFNKESKGRWLTYNALWEPQNNFFGTAIATEDQKELTLSDVLKSKTMDAQLSAGFKSQTRIVPDGNGGTKTEILTPGNQIAQSIYNTSLDTNKVAGIISADDVAGYIGALMDAVIYRYGLLTMNGIAGSLTHSDSENTSTAYADYQNAAFSQINSITFKNDRSLFNSNFNSMLATKQSTLININQAINIETNLKDALTTLLNCDVSAAFPSGQTTSISNQFLNIQDELTVIEAAISNFQSSRSGIQNDITTIQSTQSEFNAMNPQDTNSEDLMVKTYNNLVTNGTMDTQVANQALSDSQTNLASAQTYSNNLLQSNADLGGYQDIISACASVPTIIPSSTSSTTPQ